MTGPDGRPTEADEGHEAQRPGVTAVEPSQTDPREVAARALSQSSRYPFRFGFVIGALSVAAAAFLVIQNGESAQFRWLWMRFAAPLWLMLLLTMAVGALVWETIKTVARRGRRARRERREALRSLREHTPVR